MLKLKIWAFSRTQEAVLFGASCLVQTTFPCPAGLGSAVWLCPSCSCLVQRRCVWHEPHSDVLPVTTSPSGERQEHFWRLPFFLMRTGQRSLWGFALSEVVPKPHAAGGLKRLLMPHPCRQLCRQAQRKSALVNSLAYLLSAWCSLWEDTQHIFRGASLALTDNPRV